MYKPTSISQLITQHPHKSGELGKNATQEETPQAREQLIDNLWDKMTEIYGHSFTSSYGKTDNGTWKRILSDVSGKEMAAGLSLCVSKGLEWPPNAIKFRNLCLGLFDGSEEDKTIAGQQAIQARELPLLITKKPTEEERKQGEQILADLMKINWA